METNKIYQGDCREIMRQWDDECIDMCISSPPYWGLRDYKLKPLIWGGDENCEHKFGSDRKVKYNAVHHGAARRPWQEEMKMNEKNFGCFCSLCGAWKGQLGLEPTFDLYIKHLCDIFDEVKRVLKKEGSIWVNMGDSYGGANSRGSSGCRAGYGTEREGVFTRGTEKSLCCIPDRFKIEMGNRGWILRNTIIWHKPNPMPSSAKDRFTVDFEYLFFFVKNKKYYFEQQFEEHDPNSLFWKTHPKGQKSCSRTNRRENKNDGTQPNKWLKELLPSQGRNMRCVWTIPTMPCSEAHFAVFPEKLLMIPIKAGCPEFICKKCGKARVKIMNIVRDKETQTLSTKFRDNGSSHNFGGMRWESHPEFEGYTNCNCNAGFEDGIVLDPFAGRGTTGIVAQKLGRRYILIDLSPEYVKMAKRNLSQGWLV